MRLKAAVRYLNSAQEPPDSGYVNTTQHRPQEPPGAGYRNTGKYRPAAAGCLHGCYWVFAFIQVNAFQNYVKDGRHTMGVRGIGCCDLSKVVQGSIPYEVDVCPRRVPYHGDLGPMP